MNDQKVDSSSPPVYSPNAGPQQQQYPQAAGQRQYNPFAQQQGLPNVQAQYQQTTTTTTVAAQPQMVPMQQPQMTGVQQQQQQPQMMPMQPQMTGQPQMVNMGMQPQQPGMMMNVVVGGQQPMMTNYMNLCANGQHARTTKYGACGIITAILCFPIGLLALLVDVEEYCTRCGTRF